MPKFYRCKISLSGVTEPPKIFLAEGLSEALFLDELFQNEQLDTDEMYVFCFR